MTAGAPQYKPFKCITIRPGPVMHLWENGQELAAIQLTTTMCLDLIGQLASAAHFAKALPNEGLAFNEHLARREAERQPYADHIGRADE